MDDSFHRNASNMLQNDSSVSSPQTPIAAVDSSFHLSYPVEDAEETELGSIQSVRVKEGSSALEKSFGKAGINGSFKKIKHGIYEGQPASLICIAVDIGYDEAYKLDRLYVQLQFTSEEIESKVGQEKMKDPSLTVFPIIGALGPKNLQSGSVESFSGSKAYDTSMVIDTMFVKFQPPSVSGSKSYTVSRQWSVTGRKTNPDIDKQFRTAKWTCQGSLKTVQENFPRSFHIGVIVEHGNQPFLMKAVIHGNLYSWKKLWPFGSADWRKSKPLAAFVPDQNATAELTDSSLEKVLEEANSGLTAQGTPNPMLQPSGASSAASQQPPGAVASTLQGMVNLAESISDAIHSNQTENAG
jgi:hypothetical protein